MTGEVAHESTFNSQPVHRGERVGVFRTAHLAGEQGILGIGPDGELLHLRMMVQPQRRFKRGLPECRPIAAYKRSSVAVLGPSCLIDCPLIVTPAPPSPD